MHAAAAAADIPETRISRIGIWHVDTSRRSCCSGLVAVVYWMFD